MEIGLIMQRIKFYLTKPITIISLLAIVFTVILLAGTNFILPDFYNNREQALALAQTVSPSDVGAATASLESLQHKIFNTVFQIWGWLIVLLLFIFSCKIDFFRSFSNIKIFKNKIFIYLWINLSYLLYCICYIPAYMTDLEKYVYNSYADSMGIPFFTELFISIFIGLIYYPVINVLFFIVYNTKIKGRFYDFLFVLGGIYVIFNIIRMFIMKFTYFHLFLNLYNLVWLILICYTIKHQIEKRKSAMLQNNQDKVSDVCENKE